METPYVATVPHVREVTLLGTADLACWQSYLRDECFLPQDTSARAHLMITAASMKFMGLPFTEISLSVLGTDVAAAAPGAFLVQAFNSSRVFAWCERILFSTPYFNAQCAVSTNAPVSMELRLSGRALMHALMGSAREPHRTGEEGWSGRVHLPGRPGREKSRGRFFLAKLHGVKSAYPFIPDEDICSIVAPESNSTWRTLAESNFVAREWLVRKDATHAKSKTFGANSLRYLEKAK